MKLSERMYEYQTGEMDRWADEVAQLEAEVERLRDKVEILKMVVMESPEALKLVRAILYEHTKKDALEAGGDDVAG